MHSLIAENCFFLWIFIHLFSSDNEDVLGGQVGLNFGTKKCGKFGSLNRKESVTLTVHLMTQHFLWYCFSILLSFFLLQDEVRDPRQVLARPTWVADRGVRCDRPQWSGKSLGCAFGLANGNFSLFGLANTHISVCSVWPMPIIRPVRSGQYPYFGLFGLANTQVPACSVRPIPKFRSARSGQYPNFGLFGLANTHILVCSVCPRAIFLSVRSGQYSYFGLFGLADT